MTVRPGLSDDLLSTIAAWVRQDPDPVTRSQVDDLVCAARTGDLAAVVELTDAFTGRLQFGTAGLRGPLGPGPSRMNRVVVGQAAAGLASYLLDSGLAGGRVMIGYDARNNSDVFARDTAEIMAGAGFSPLLTDGPSPTPVAVFGIRHFSCVAGVVVTASHNPPRDNGYKVYLGDGSQIVPPADADIASRISEIARDDFNDVPRSTDYAILGGELVSAYLGRIASLVPRDAERELRWVYTPLHGVGAAVVAGAVAASGFPAASVVAEQAEPDPAFPTVAFPNPEEPGAIDLALAQAETTRADLVVANDPDADRCAVAAPIGGHWRMLRGDELGALLADDALRRKVRGTYACSIVSSSLLSVMAAESGQPFTYTLTGFKWIGRVPGLAFGYEEALGYCVDPDAVRDKDGISALIRVLALAAECKAERLSLADRLDGIARRYGIYETDQLSVRVDDVTIIADVMARLRARPPELLAGQPVAATDLLHGTEQTDLLHGTEQTDLLHGTEQTDLLNGTEQLPPTDAIRMVGQALTVVVRPSGTEPKLKCYLEARMRPPHTADLPSAREEARSILRRLRTDLATALGLPNI